jgi:hypothetical protein
LFACERILNFGFQKNRENYFRPETIRALSQFRRFAGYAAPAPRSPGTSYAGRTGEEKMA